MDRRSGPDPVASLMGPGSRRRETTLLAASLLALGAPGLALCSAGLAKAAAGRSNGAIVLTDAVLLLLGKAGLVAAGAAMLARSRRTPAIAWAALAVSAAGALHTLIRVAPRQAATLKGAAFIGYSLGAYSACLFSLLIYAAVILYLRTEPARKEFGL